MKAIRILRPRTGFLLIISVVVALVAASISPIAADRSNTSSCMQSCTAVEKSCKAECQQTGEICQDACIGLPDEGECLASCDAATHACNSFCIDAKKECKAACPKGKQSPDEPLP